MSVKICLDCKRGKSVNEFTATKQGWLPRCRLCNTKHEWCKRNPDKDPSTFVYKPVLAKTNRDYKEREGNKRCSKCHVVRASTEFTRHSPGQCKECFNKTLSSNQKTNAERTKACHMESRMRRYTQYKEVARQWRRSKYATDTQFKAACILRSRVYKAIKAAGGAKDTSCEELLGCTVEDFVHYIAAKFNGEMGWHNHGTSWEIDHIQPLASFDLTDILQQKKAFNYKNCQPLLVADNRSKGSTVPQSAM